MKKTNLMPSIIVTVLLAAGLLAQTPAVTVVATPAPVINRGNLSPTFRNLLGFMGDRLAIAGNERLTLNGTVTLSDGSKTIAIVTLELPDHLRYVQTLPQRIITYDGSTVLTSSGPPTTVDNNLVESVVLDGVERFLIGQAQGLALRFMGPHIQFVDPANSPRPTSLCELYQVSEKERFISNVKTKQKLFCFDSHTRLIASAFYQNPASGSSITRYENGKVVFSLAVAGSAVAAAQNDGIFNKP